MYNKIGIIGAMEEEVAILIDRMEISNTIIKAGMKYYEGKLSDKNVVVVMSGIGKINATVCSQILIDIFKVDTLINTGVAGSLNDEINIGDIVISSDTLNHDMDAVGFGYEHGVIPRMNKKEFKADENLISIAKKACKKVNDKLGVFVGRVISGDQFIADIEKKEWLIKTFNGYCAEMEGVAIGQTAYLNDIPFVILRAISDKCHDEAGMDYMEFKNMAVVNLSNSVITMLSML